MAYPPPVTCVPDGQNAPTPRVSPWGMMPLLLLISVYIRDPAALVVLKPFGPASLIITTTATTPPTMKAISTCHQRGKSSSRKRDKATSSHKWSSALYGLSSRQGGDGYLHHPRKSARIIPAASVQSAVQSKSGKSRSTNSRVSPPRSVR